MTKQVYRVKKNDQLTKNSDLTLEKEKSIIEEMSASSIDQIASNVEHASNDVAEQQLSSAGGQEQKRDTRSAETGLETGLTGSSGSVVENPSNKSKARPSFKELLAKYEKEGAAQKQRRWSNKVKDVKSTSTSGDRTIVHVKVIVVLCNIQDRLLHGFGRILVPIHLWIIVGYICSLVLFNILLYVQIVVHHKD